VAQSNFKSSGSDGISLLNSLISDINSKQVAKRALFSHLPFEIGHEFKISVKGYNLIQKQEKARKGYVWLDGESKQYVEPETGQITEDTARPVEKVEIKKAYKFGGSLVFFTPEELKELKNFGSPVLRIIGFKPQSMLPFWASVKKSTFIYPSEEDYVGSTRVFSALWQKLIKDKKMGVAWYIARANAAPVLVAILPSEERADDTTKLTTIPAGLWLYQLPFVDDKRELGPLPKPLVAPDNLTSEMRKVIKQLQLPKAIYDHSKYPNPALQWHYKILQALALDEELPEKPEDKTIPKFRQIDKRAGEYINEWGQILEKEIRAYQKEQYGGIDGTSLKRDRDDSEDPPKKKIKPSHSGQTLDGMSTSDLKKVVGSGNLSKYTVQDLRDLLSAKGLNAKGKKAELAERIEQWIEDN
jgi:ATP-dependent DNA helicase 2 subunit 1